MAHFLEHCFYLLFIEKPGVVRANRDFHRPNSSMMIGPDQRFLCVEGSRFVTWQLCRRLPTDRPKSLQSGSPPEPGSGLDQLFADNSLGVTRKSNISVL